MLKIPLALIDRHGAVSAVIAGKMAQQARKISRANFGIGITGIAGPKGGSVLKPVGTVFIAVTDGSKTLCAKFLFKGKRGGVRIQAALTSLRFLKALLARK
jgi:PncC family amidohydrolase